MSETVRAFVAIEIPEQARTAISELVDRLDGARVRGMRTVRPEIIHLTIKFLGEVPVTRIEAITAALSGAAARCGPFSLELGAVGVYPSHGRTRVLWIGLKGDLASVVDLHAGIEDALAGLGIDGDRRPYTPHLTVARMADHASATDRRSAVEALHAAGIQAGIPVAASAIVLMRSRLSREGARHHPLARMPLGETLDAGAS